jgi:hypothetical protein
MRKAVSDTLDRLERSAHTERHGKPAHLQETYPAYLAIAYWQSRAGNPVGYRMPHYTSESDKQS